MRPRVDLCPTNSARPAVSQTDDVSANLNAGEFVIPKMWRSGRARNSSTS